MGLKQERQRVLQECWRCVSLCPALAHLDLNENQIGPDGVESLAGVLGQCASLAHLCFNSNQVATVTERKRMGATMICQCGNMSCRVPDVAEILLSLTSVKAVIVSINPQWWDWWGEVSPTRVKGRITKWSSKREGTEQPSIQWELGIWDDGYIAGQVTYTEPQVSDLSKPSAATGKFLSDAKYAFTLEAYDNGTPAPTVVTVERKSIWLWQVLVSWLSLTFQNSIVNLVIYHCWLNLCTTDWTSFILGFIPKHSVLPDTEAGCLGRTKAMICMYVVYTCILCVCVYVCFSCVRFFSFSLCVCVSLFIFSMYMFAYLYIQYYLSLSLSPRLSLSSTHTQTCTHIHSWCNAHTYIRDKHTHVDMYLSLYAYIYICIYIYTFTYIHWPSISFVNSSLFTESLL
jgi:hypothetical protein